MTVSKSLLKYYENPGSELGDYEEGTDEPKTKVDPPAPDEDIEDTDEDPTAVCKRVIHKTCPYNN